MMDSHSSSTRASAKKLRCVASFDSPDCPNRNVQKMITPFAMALGFILPQQIPFIWKGLLWTDATFCITAKGATSNLAAFRLSCGAYAAWHYLRTFRPVGGCQARLGPCVQFTYCSGHFSFHVFMFI